LLYVKGYAQNYVLKEGILKITNTNISYLRGLL